MIQDLLKQLSWAAYLNAQAHKLPHIQTTKRLYHWIDGDIYYWSLKIYSAERMAYMHEEDVTDDPVHQGEAANRGIFP